MTRRNFPSRFHNTPVRCRHASRNNKPRPRYPSACNKPTPNHASLNIVPTVTDHGSLYAVSSGPSQAGSTTEGDPWAIWWVTVADTLLGQGSDICHVLEYVAGTIRRWMDTKLFFSC